MIPFYHLPDKQEYSQIFYANFTTNWQVWRKPKNCTVVSIICLGGGGGGSSGVGGSNTTRAGGASGAAADYGLGTFIACMLPDILYVRVGHGGIGGAETTTSTQNSGSAGNLSYVSVVPDTPIVQNILIQSGSLTAKGATTLTGGAAGSSWNIINGNHLLYTFGLVSSRNGFAGKNSSGGAGTNVTVTSVVCEGASGAGVSSGVATAGGNITAVGFFPGIPGGTASGAGGTINGSSGLNNIPTFISPRSFAFFTGGSGGGSINVGVGGRGGDGGFGCGGGGGGGGNTGGAGGKGGDGLVIINAW